MWAVNKTILIHKGVIDIHYPYCGVVLVFLCDITPGFAEHKDSILALRGCILLVNAMVFFPSMFC